MCGPNPLVGLHAARLQPDAFAYAGAERHAGRERQLRRRLPPRRSSPTRSRTPRTRCSCSRRATAALTGSATTTTRPRCTRVSTRAEHPLRRRNGSERQQGRRSPTTATTGVDLAAPGVNILERVSGMRSGSRRPSRPTTSAPLDHRRNEQHVGAGVRRRKLLLMTDSPAGQLPEQHQLLGPQHRRDQHGRV